MVSRSTGGIEAKGTFCTDGRQVKSASFPEELPVELLRVLLEPEEDFLDGTLLTALLTTLLDTEIVGRVSAFNFWLNVAAGTTSVDPALGPLLVRSVLMAFLPGRRGRTGAEDIVPVALVLVALDSMVVVASVDGRLDTLLVAFRSVDVGFATRLLVDFAGNDLDSVKRWLCALVSTALARFLAALVSFRDCGAGFVPFDVSPEFPVSADIETMVLPGFGLRFEGSATRNRFGSMDDGFGALISASLARFLAAMVSFRDSGAGFVLCDVSPDLPGAADVETMVLPGFGFDGSATSSDCCFSSRESIMLWMSFSVGKVEVSGDEKLTSHISRWK